MSYQEENGTVVLRMSKEDFEENQRCIVVAALFHLQRGEGEINDRIFAFLDRLNQGNPNYTPYQVTK